MAKVYLGLGSNMGDKKEYIDNALGALDQHEDIEVTKVSSYYETEPVGFTEQDLFLNLVAEIDTLLSPYELFQFCQEIEKELKRKKAVKWGPRTIDIDILLYENYSSHDEKLTIPHPRMGERAFVIVPLYEIAKDIIIDEIRIEDLVKNLNQKGIRRLGNAQF